MSDVEPDDRPPDPTLIELRGSLGGPADVTGAVRPLRTASTTAESVYATSNNALTRLSGAWQGPAADATAHHVSIIGPAASSITHTAASMADILERAASDLDTSRTQLDRILDSFNTLAGKIAPVLRTPPGHTSMINAARDHLSRALAVIKNLQGRLDAHGAELRALAAPAGIATTPADTTPHPPNTPTPPGAAPLPAGVYTGSGYRPLTGGPSLGFGGYPYGNGYPYGYGMFGGPLREIVGDIGEVGSAGLTAGIHAAEHLTPDVEHRLAHHTDASPHPDDNEPDPIHPEPALPGTPLGSGEHQPTATTTQHDKNNNSSNDKDSNHKDGADKRNNHPTGSGPHHPARPVPPATTKPANPPPTTTPPSPQSEDQKDLVHHPPATPPHPHGQPGVTTTPTGQK